MKTERGRLSARDCPAAAGWRQYVCRCVTVSDPSVTPLRRPEAGQLSRLSICLPVEAARDCPGGKSGVPLCSDCASPCASSPTNYVSLSSQPHVVGRRAVRLGREGTRREDIRVQRLCQSEGVAMVSCSVFRASSARAQRAQLGTAESIRPHLGSESWGDVGLYSASRLARRARTELSRRVWRQQRELLAPAHHHQQAFIDSSNDTSYSAQFIEA